jgi:hypothetical protein
MGILKRIVFLFLVVTSSVLAQGTRKDDIAITSVGGFLSGIPNASVRVCASGASGIPCNPLANVYSNSNLVPGNLLPNPFTADANGNYFFYAPAGNYVIQITSATGTAYTQNDVTLPNLPSVVTTTFNYSLLAFSSTPAFNFTPNTAFKLTLTGNVTSSTLVGAASPGAFAAFSLCQDGVGGHSFVFPPNFSPPSGFTFATAANICKNLLFFYDGTNWQGVGGGGGGGGTPGGANQQIQFNSLGTFAGVPTFTYDGTNLNVDANLRIKGPNPWFDICRFGCYASTNTPSTTIGTISGGTSSLAVSSAASFQIGHGIEINGAGPATALSTPNAPTVTPVNITGGSTTYTYQVVAEDFNNALTAASATGTTTTGQASLGVATVVVTQASRLNGIATYTTSGNHNIQVGASIQVDGFTGTTGFNGDFVVASVPSGTTFTVYQPNGGGNTSQTISATVEVMACNKVLWNPQVASQLGLTLRHLIYRNGALVATSVGADPYYQDCGFQEGGFPAYYPTSSPVASQAGNFSTTITNIIGSVLTLAANVSTGVTNALVQHDNWPAIKQAYQAAVTEHGGQVYIPTDQADGGFYVINSPVNLPAIASAGISIGFVQKGRVLLNQPIITVSNFEWKGEVRVSGAGGSLFTGNEIDGIAQPMVYVPGQQAVVKFKGVLFNCASVLQSCVTIDTATDGFGSSPIFFEDFNFTGPYSSEAKLTQRGGFGLYFTRGNCTQTSATFGTGPCIRQTTGSSALAAGMTIAGNLVMRDVGLVGAGYQVDTIPLGGSPAAINNQTWSAENIFSGILFTPVFNVGYSTQAFSLNNILGFGQHGNTPMIDTTLASVAFASAFNANVTIGIFNYNGLPFYAGPFSSPQQALTGTSRVFFSQPSPTGLIATASSGGGVLVGPQSYAVSVTDLEGNESLPLITTALTISSGNQTVTLSCTPPSEALNLQFYNFYKFDSVNGVYKLAVGGNHQSTCNFVDTSATFGSVVGPSGIGAAETSLDANGLRTYQLSMGALVAFPLPLTASRTQRFPDLSGTFAMVNAAQNWTSNQSNMPLVTPTIGGETISSAPRSLPKCFFPGALSITWTGCTETLDKGIIVTRMQAQVKTIPSGCGTNAIVRVTDGSSPINLTVSSAANDSGVISQAYAAGAVLVFSIQTAAATCTTTPGDLNLVIQSKMQ